jgi:hypothetical protein
MGYYESLSFSWQIAVGSVMLVICLMVLVITSINIAFLDNTSELTAGGLKTANWVFLVVFGIVGMFVGSVFIYKSTEFHKKYMEVTGKLTGNLPRAEQGIELQPMGTSTLSAMSNTEPQFISTPNPKYLGLFT